MAEERIHITIEDEELEDAKLKVDAVLGAKTKTSSWELERSNMYADSLMSKQDQIKEMAKDLPKVSREMRLIVTQIPGLRTALNLYYKIGMLGRAELTLSSIIILIYLAKAILQHIDRLKKEEEDYRDMIAEARGFKTKGEVEAWMSAQNQRQEQYRSQPTP